ncbi:MAG: PAS domain-containing protein [Chloroflexi bacterium]|nr:PAS domain-containing protein [Ardenticatenaceae bacterium]MBL1131063.1 PAS domain S-box protein [Chloroflexota bacterium]NOG37162.1 PAS domain-containing protein [Chloroflexota bacterium]GIK54842.1 MAG: PAS domain-containing sensor histidine kinase [Chloroflexota bacterium]
MQPIHLPYLLPYAISFLISLSVAMYAWQRRSVPGARAFALATASQAAWTFGYIFELNSDTLAAKLFWDNVQFIATFIWPLAFLAFSMAYTGRPCLRPFLTWTLLVLPFLLFWGLMWTDRYHGLVRPSASLVPGEPFDALIYDFTAVVWLVSSYAYVLAFYALYLLVFRFTWTQALYRQQMFLVVIGVLIPMVGVLLTLMGVTFTFQRDTTPITFAISNLLIAWGLFRYHLFDIVPVARDTVFDGISDYVLVLDANNRLVDMNPAAQRALGVPASRLIGQPAVQVLATWDDLVRGFGAETSLKTEIKIDRQGQTRFLALRITPLYAHKDNGRGSNGRIIVARDVTERRRAEQMLEERSEQLQAANEELRILSQVKDEFVANVSHELRTPLTNIKLYHDLLTRYPHRQEQYLAVLQRETDRLETLIEDLLLLSRLDREVVALKFEIVDLNMLVENIVHDRQALVESCGLTITLRLPVTAVLVQADATLTSQVLSVLLTNAMNYTPSGGTIEVYTEVGRSHGRNWAGFCVQDTGPGILPAEQEKLFSRFFRGEAAHSSQTAGTGLGLAIAKEIIDRHHGRITIESTGIPGQGAAFHVWLPAGS